MNEECTNQNANTPIPLRECEPWCDSPRDGHPKEHPEDRRCNGEFHQVALTGRQPVRLVDGSWVFDSLDVVLVREREAATASVVIGDETNNLSTQLNLEEARELAETLLRLVDKASGPTTPLTNEEAAA